MKFTLSWLKEHLETKASLEQITETLTNIGLEVEQVVDKSKELADFIVAEIVQAEKHPNADKLKVCKVNNGKEELQIVCGAANARAGIKVVLAQVGVLIPNGEFKIKASEIRGVKSNGMLCSAGELNLGGDSEGIIELPKDAKVGERATNWLAGGNDPVIEIAITPNRGDCLGVYGVARDLAAAGIGTLKKLEVKKIKASGNSPINTKTETETCPYFIGRYIKGVKNGQSSELIKQRLEAIGQKTISALVDITNYLTIDLGRPAHVYDADKLKGNLVVRGAKKGEKLLALDDKTYALEEGMTVIADDSGPVAIAGIIGGKATGCDENTKNVYLEIAYFNPAGVMKTGQKLQINSDARFRFERGVDQAFVKDGANIATNMILELCGGVASEIVEAGKEPKAHKEINFDTGAVKRITGVEVGKNKIEEILKSLGMDPAKSGEALLRDDRWVVKVPSWRSDISIQQDLVEEVVRILGYDKIPAIAIPRDGKKTMILNPAQKKISDVRKTLAGRGVSEAVNLSFVSSKQAEIFSSTNDNVELENPISRDLSTMRPSILPSLLEALRKNEARGFSNVAMFEIGPVFKAATPDGQRISVAGIRAGKAAEKNVHGGERAVDLFDAKADAFAAISNYIDPEKLSITRDAPKWYHPGKSGSLILGKQVLGFFGELHPSVLQRMDVEGPVAAFEIFPQNAPEPKEKRSAARAKLEMSNFQSVERDFAFLVDEKITAAEILKAVKQAEKNLISGVDIFDVYQGKGVELGKKSVAFSIRLEPKDRTLTDKEIETVSQQVISSVEKSVGGVLRG